MAPLARPVLSVLLAIVATAAVAAPSAMPERGRPAEPKGQDLKSHDLKAQDLRAHDLKAQEPKAQDRKPAASLNELYERLRDAEDDAEAKGVATLIERRLDRSGSATADLLTDRARQAMTAQDFALAAELMDRVTAIEPAWSEGWNRRATVF